MVAIAIGPRAAGGGEILSEQYAFQFRETLEILRRLAEAHEADLANGRRPPKIVLIGGQAVNYWVDHYRDRDSGFNRTFASKDVDFQAESHEVDWVARVLGVAARKPSQDHATEQTGKIVFTMVNGEECAIDFLRRSIPNDSNEVRKRAIPAFIGDSSLTFWVMHPLLCLRSRAANVIDLRSQYENEHGLEQLRAAVVCLRYFILEVHEHDPREALNLVNKVYRYAKSDRVGKAIYRRHGIDPFDAVPHDYSLGDGFFNRSYPLWRDELAAKRAAYRGRQ